MKPRNREVNIFNMSLLDILCGALGAFCFMMLSLFPDHAKVKELEAKIAQSGGPGAMGSGDAEARAKAEKKRADEAEARADQARAEQSLAYFKIRWAAPSDVDIWVMFPSGKYCAPKPASVPAAQRADCGKVGDDQNGPGQEQIWFTDVAYPKNEYRLFAHLERTKQTDPTQIIGIIGARVPRGTGNSMEMYDSPIYQLKAAGDLLEVGRILFDRESYDIAFGPKTSEPPKPGGNHLPAPADRLRFLPPDAVAPAVTDAQRARR